MSWIRNTVCAVLAIALSGCATMEIAHDYDTAYDYSKLNTYSWVPAGPKGRGFRGNSLLEDRVRSAVDRQLQAKGFVKTEGRSPDFFVNYTVTLDQKTNIQIIQEHYDYRPITWGAAPGHTMVDVHEYDEGTLILDIIDARTRKLIWRGSAKDEVNLSATPEKKTRKINEAVERILQGFPAP